MSLIFFWFFLKNINKPSFPSPIQRNHHQTENLLTYNRSGHPIATTEAFLSYPNSPQSSPQNSTFVLPQVKILYQFFTPIASATLFLLPPQTSQLSSPPMPSATFTDTEASFSNGAPVVENWVFTRSLTPMHFFTGGNGAVSPVHTRAERQAILPRAICSRCRRQQVRTRDVRFATGTFCFFFLSTLPPPFFLFLFLFYNLRIFITPCPHATVAD